MRKVLSESFLITIVMNMILSTSGFSQEITWYASGNGGAVAAGPVPSVQAGIEMLTQGGNAVDGAVAVIFNLAVSEYGRFSIGGESPFMFYNTKTGKVLVYNGMGSAPKDQAAIDWYYANGIPERGLKAATVPSAVSTCMKALEQNGTMTFEKIIAPTLTLLDTREKAWYPNLAVTLRKMVEVERSTTGTREQKIRAARDRFYKGDIADELNDFYIQSGGLLRKADLESHETLVEEPVSVSYRGYTVNKCNTWTQGAVLLQSLRLLENFDLKSMGFFSADYIHTTTEAMKLAYADRDKYYGDPRFVDVPLKKLLSDKYTRLRYPLIDMNHASGEIRPGDPYKMKATVNPGEIFPGDHGTSTCVVVDRWGNVVAATPSSNPEYGICESLGIAHNTRLSSLNTQRGHPNAIEPGKRPRITLTPTIVLKKGKPVIAMAVSGGDMQDQVALQLLLDFIDFGQMPKEAVLSPRFMTNQIEDSFNTSPVAGKRIFKMNSLDIYPTDQSTIDNLKSRGHDVSIVNDNIARPVMIYIDQATGISYAACHHLPTLGKHCAALNIPK